MRALLLIVLSASAFAQSPSPVPREPPATVMLQYVHGHLSDLVKLYRTLSNRKVWLDAEVRFDRKISLVSDRPIPRDEAIRRIREALLKERVEIREVGDSEAYVSLVAR